MKRACAPFLLAVASVAEACGDELPGPKRTVENSDWVIAYATTPPRITVGKHFVVDFAICPRGRAPVPKSVRVDANMPEHKHGMNYRASVTRAGPGHYRAEGLLLHMAGRWELTFDVVTGSGTERLATTIMME